ncbi:MAG: PEP-CTERM sorting domain-containing protein [Verrucomicrobiota bacterium]
MAGLALLDLRVGLLTASINSIASPFSIGWGVAKQYALDNITASPLVNLSGNNIEVTYANANFGIKLSYTLQGYASGSGHSGATLGVNLVNYQASPLDFHLFQYSDFDLGGSTGAQSVSFLKALGKFNRAVQTTGSLSMTNTFNGTALPNPTPQVEANTFNTTLLSLADLSQTSFNSLSTNAGPGNVTYAIQYDLLLNAGESFVLSEQFSMAVPEPTSAGLLLIAIGSLALGYRKKS